MGGIFGAEISLVEAGMVTLICMGIVFTVLMLIAGILTLFKYIPAGNEKAKVAKKEVAATPKAAAVEKAFDPNSITDERMVAAMLVASIEAAAENDGAYIRVKNIREI